jgi:hypothetical protein
LLVLYVHHPLLSRNTIYSENATELHTPFKKRKEQMSYNSSAKS